MSTAKTILTPQDHDRDSAGMTYVYPVVSRRARGVSIGINLNPNNACNWRCIYCQVPNLTRGAAPEIDLAKLEHELRTMLHDAVHGSFMQQRVPQEARRLEDIAFSGNGEPTSSAEFGATLVVVERVLRDFNLLGQLPVRLITNGSLIEKPGVLDAIRHLGQINGEVWFKVDAATTEGIARINDVRLNPQGVVERLELCAQACPTWIQTCVFALDGKPPSNADIDAYFELLTPVKDKIKGVLLYGLARPSLQAEAPRLTSLPASWLKAFAARAESHQLLVRVST